MQSSGQAISQRGASRAPPQNAVAPAADRVLKVIGRLLDERGIKGARLRLDDALGDAGVTSLDMLKLVLSLEAEFGLEIPETAIRPANFRSGLTICRMLAGLTGETPAAVPSVRTQSSDPQIREVSPGEVDGLGRFLRAGFGHIDERVWLGMFQYAWIAEKPNLGLVIHAEGRIRGFLGTIYATRRVNGKTGLVCNLSSLYVEPDYRTWAPMLMAAAVRDESVSYTALTPGRNFLHIAKAMGFEPLDRSRLFLPPLTNSLTLRPGSEIVSDPESVRSRLAEPERRIFDHHRPYDCLQLAVQERSEATLLIAKRRVLRGVPVSELLYCGSPPLLARHLERVKIAVIARQKTVALAIDSRFADRSIRGLRLPQRAIFRSPVFSANEIDRLYSELVLLPI